MNHKRIENVFLICLMLGIYTVFVSNTGTGFPCLFRYFTHLQCPGCGVTHMLLELLHGNFREAYNASSCSAFVGTIFTMACVKIFICIYNG